MARNTLPYSLYNLLSFVGISGISYLALKSKDKTDFEKLNLNQKEKEIYEKAYLNTVSKRRLKYIVGSTIVTGAVAFLMLMGAMSGFSGGGSKNKFTEFGQT